MHQNSRNSPYNGRTLHRRKKMAVSLAIGEAIGTVTVDVTKLYEMNLLPFQWHEQLSAFD